MSGVVYEYKLYLSFLFASGVASPYATPFFGEWIWMFVYVCCDVNEMHDLKGRNMLSDKNILQRKT